MMVKLKTVFNWMVKLHNKNYFLKSLKFNRVVKALLLIENKYKMNKKSVTT